MPVDWKQLEQDRLEYEQRRLADDLDAERSARRRAMREQAELDAEASAEDNEYRKKVAARLEVIEARLAKLEGKA